MRMRKQKITDVDCEPRAFMRKHAAEVGMDGKLDAAGEREKLINPEHAGAEKYLVGIAARDRNAFALNRAGVLANQFGEEPPIDRKSTRLNSSHVSEAR